MIQSIIILAGIVCLSVVVYRAYISEKERDRRRQNEIENEVDGIVNGFGKMLDDAENRLTGLKEDFKDKNNRLQ